MPMKLRHVMPVLDGLILVLAGLLIYVHAANPALETTIISIPGAFADQADDDLMAHDLLVLTPPSPQARTLVRACFAAQVLDPDRNRLPQLAVFLGPDKNHAGQRPAAFVELNQEGVFHCVEVREGQIPAGGIWRLTVAPGGSDKSVNLTVQLVWRRG